MSPRAASADKHAEFQSTGVQVATEVPNILVVGMVFGVRH